MVAGDFNGDGRLDLATANATPTASRCCWATATARSSPRRYYAVGISLGSIVAGDFNGDGRLDLASANRGLRRTSRSRCCWATVTARSRRSSSNVAKDSVRDNSLVAGDFNGDGRLDLATATTDFDTRSRSRCCWATVTARFSPRGSTRRETIPRILRWWPGISTVTVGSTWPSLGYNVDSYSVEVRVLLGTGDGGVEPPERFALDGGGLVVCPELLMAGDFNGDGRLDLAPPRKDIPALPTVFRCYWATATVGFDPQQPFAAGDVPSAQLAGDFNGDGRLDLAVADSVLQRRHHAARQR